MSSQAPVTFNPNSPWCYDPFVYRIFYGALRVEQPIVTEVCGERGWREYGEEQRKMAGSSTLGWNLWWRCTTLNVAPMRTLYSWQFTNQIPRGIGFCNKEYLRHFIILLRTEFGSIADICPTTFILPKEWDGLKQENDIRLRIGATPGLNEVKIKKCRNLVPLSETRKDSNNNRPTRRHIPIWITKPVGKSQGKGIMVTDDLSQFQNVQSTTVVQEYLARPFLIGGYKFDLRLYVCVTCTNPLTVYVYREGLTRFATDQYDLKDLNNNFSHLTNASLNKNGEHYSEDKEHIGFGCKWTLGQLRKHFASIGVTDFYIWQRIWSILVVTILGDANRITQIPFSKNCFAFLGYDILIDKNMVPYLLEVNLAPGLNADSDVDVAVKKPMLHDLFTLMGLPRYPRKRPTTSQRPPTARPETSSGIPRSYYRPSTVGTAMALIDQKNKYKFVQGTGLFHRLTDMTAIYTQDLTRSLKQLQARNERNRKLQRMGTPAPLNNSSTPQNKKRFNLTPTGPGRDWGNAPAQSGGWIRIFPFDLFSHNESRNKMLEMDQRFMVNRLYHYLMDAKELVAVHPGKSDQFYVDVLKKQNKLNTEIWFPPLPDPVPPCTEIITSSEPSVCNSTTSVVDEVSITTD